MAHITKPLALIGVLSMLLSLGGCGGQAASGPAVWEPLDLSSLTTAAAEDDYLKYRYPSDAWTLEPDATGNMVAVYKETSGTQYPVNISAQISAPYNEELDREMLDNMTSLMENDAAMTVDVSELRSFNGSAIIYLETTFQFTEEIIDQMLESGQWSEADLEAVGGREVFLNTPKTTGITVAAVVDGHLVVYGGACYEDAQKQAVRDALNVIIQTTEIK